MSTLRTPDGFAAADPPTDDGPARDLRGLAVRYRLAAGAAFAAGADQEALRFREAARELDALASSLPPLPRVTR